MSRLQKRLIFGAALTIAISAGVIAYFAVRSGGGKSTAQPAENADSPTVDVKTAALQQGEIAQTTTAFGSVIAQSGAIEVLSVPYDCRVDRIFVTTGQPVGNAADLIEIEPSPAARLSLQEAQSGLDAAKADLSQAQQRFDLKLGTTADLLLAQQAMKLAQLRLDNLKGQGLQDHRVLQSSSAGLIARIDAQQGQIVPAGNPLIETVAQDKLEVRLGVDPAQVAHLSVGQAVRLFPGDGSQALAGKIRLITQSINPDTRLIDVIVTPDSRDGLMLNSFIRAELVTEEKKEALLAPHEAVLPEGDGYTLFTVKDGKAVKHTVTLGLQNNLQAAVSADDLHAGDTIVVQGNLELNDQMPVKVEDAPEESR